LAIARHPFSGYPGTYAIGHDCKTIAGQRNNQEHDPVVQWNLPVEPDELLYALKVGNAAALNQMPLRHTPGQGLDVVDEETGQVQTVHFEDSAVNRFGVAIAREFDNMGSKFFSLMTRIGALMRLLEDDRAKPYVELEGEFTKIRNAMIETMASFPISPEGFLDVDQFFSHLAAAGNENPSRVEQ
jgi:hypothetical protein